MPEARSFPVIIIRAPSSVPFSNPRKSVALTGIDPTLLDPVLLDFSNRRATQKAKYRGELFPKDAFATPQGSRFIDFFQVDKLTQQAKGILVLDLSTL